MGVLKNKAYFKRFQVKYRRRREGKTDYRARRKMVRQDKNKYNNRKYRLVVRFTSRKVICQIMYATIRGDMVVEQAASTELSKFGVPVGLKNYAAAYCTGLLIARRIPHNNKLFPGYKPAEDKGAEAEYDAEAHKEKIFGSHVKEYMEMMQDEDPTKYEAHFAKFIENSIDADKVEDMYTEAHSKIRADPSFSAGDKKSITYTRAGNKFTGSDGTDHVRSKKIGLEARRAKVAKKIAAAQAAMMEDDDE